MIGKSDFLKEKINSRFAAVPININVIMLIGHVFIFVDTQTTPCFKMYVLYFNWKVFVYILFVEKCKEKS